MRRALLPLAALCLLATGARRPADCSGDYCGTLVFAAGGQPDILLPPVSVSALSRDIHDQIFLKLADIGMTLNTVGDRGFVPVLAKRWEWRDSLTLVFHLDPRAHWQDGPPVTAGDVAFTFQAYTDPQVNSSSAPILAHIASVTARDSLTAVFRFRDRYPEMFYDAVYHMRILPAHLLASVPRDHWMSAAFGRAPVGDGPYRFVTWTPEYLELAADSTFFLGRPHIRRLLWRFTPNFDVAITQLIADQADALETLGPPPNVPRVQAAKQLALYRYSGTNYAFLQFNLTANGDTTRPHPILSDRQVRRAITMAVDRVKLCQSVWGDLAKAPPGPMPQAWWIWNVGTTPLPYDTTEAARLLTAALPAWNPDPTPSSSFAQRWTRAGWGRFNYGRYANPNLERLLGQATLSAADPQSAARAWRAVLDTLNQDAPGIWLFAPDNVAVVHNRVAAVTIRPDSWWALVWTWRIPPDRLLDRDRTER